MNPTIRDGETVQVRPVRPDDFRPGALLLGRHRERLILHRLIRRDAENLFLIGDAGLRGADCISIRDIAGVATSVQRGNRTLALDTRRHRLVGMLRYRLRPLRRLIWSRRHA